MSREKRFISAIEPLPHRLKTVLKGKAEYVSFASEIRMRISRPLLLTGQGKDFPISLFGSPIYVTEEDVNETFRNICEHSVYTHEEELKNGYITFSGGHRAGVCGTAYSADGKILSVRDISSICIRIAGCEKNTAASLFERVFEGKTGSIIIAGAPGSGKTTILRDFARMAGRSTAVIDERNEIAAVKNGKSEILDSDADIFSGYPKPLGIEIATRSFSPKVIICDEIAPRDTDALLNALFSGVRLVTSVHAGSREELFSRPFVKRILKTDAFETAVILKGGEKPGEVGEIIDLR